MTDRRKKTSATEKRRRSRKGAPILNPREIEGLVHLMEANGLVEIEVQNGRGKIKLVRDNHRLGGVQEQERKRGEEECARIGPSTGSGAVAVTAPMVGTFHRALELGGEALADVGDVVNRGEVLAVIEAMKMMNEIEAEFGGRIKQVLVEDGKPVEYGQPLFLMEPL